MTVLITKDNDTIYVSEMDDIQVSSPKKFKDPRDYHTYMKYKRYAAIVYPYALKAIALFKELDENTEGLKKRKAKKYAKKRHKELKSEFTDPLKNLTKTQGKILVKMIEKELELPLFELIKDYRGGWTANYWNFLAGFSGYKLKHGYVRGEDIFMDAVLDDLDLSAAVE